MSFSLSEAQQDALKDVGLFVPPDNDTMRRKFEKGGGTCGPSTIAILERTMVESVINNWRGRGAYLFRGFSPIGEMVDTLESLGYKCKRCRGNKSKFFPIPSTNYAILRVQWLKEDGSEYYWRAAGAHSHYVLITKIKGDDWWIFCNCEGWFARNSDYAERYLSGRGFISSIIEVSKTEDFTCGD